MKPILIKFGKCSDILFPALIMTILGILLLPQKIVAQESKAVDSLEFRYDISASGFISNNINRRILINSLGIWSIGTSSWNNRTVMVYQYGKVGPNKRENDFLAYDIFKIAPEKKVFPFLVAGIESTRTRDIDFRWFLGAGGGIHLVEKESMAAEFTLSVFYEQTAYGNFVLSDTSIIMSDQEDTWRFSPRLKGFFQLKDNGLRFEYEGWFQPSFKTFDDYRSFGNFALLFPTVKNLYLRIAWITIYESVVLEGRPTSDSNLSFGLTFKN